jgi:hypothetical protein
MQSSGAVRPAKLEPLSARESLSAITGARGEVQPIPRDEIDQHAFREPADWCKR